MNPIIMYDDDNGVLGFLSIVIYFSDCLVYTTSKTIKKYPLHFPTSQGATIKLINIKYTDLYIS